MRRNRWIIVLMLLVILSALGACKKDDDVELQSEKDSTEVANNLNKQAIEEDQEEESLEQKSENNETEVEADEQPLKTIAEIDADILNVRQEPTIDSRIVDKLIKGQALEVIETKKGDEGDWFKVQSSFGTIGWIAGWYCKEHESDQVDVFQSEHGKMIGDIEQEWISQLFSLVDYNINDLVEVYGDGYVEEEDGNLTRLRYEDGRVITLYDDSEEILSVEKDGFFINVNSIAQWIYDIGNDDRYETIVLFEGKSHYEFVVFDENMQVINHYKTDYYFLENYEVTQSEDDGSVYLFLSGERKSTYKPTVQENFQMISLISSDGVTTVWDDYYIDRFGQQITGKINDTNLDLSITSKDNTVTYQSQIPERLFYSHADVADRNDLLSHKDIVDVSWKDNRWSIGFKRLYELNILDYYWGPPVGDAENNSVLNSDIARIYADIEVNSDEVSVGDITCELKYPDEIIEAEPFNYDDAELNDDIYLNMDVYSAAQFLNLEDEDSIYSDIINYEGDGFYLSGYFGMITDIEVTGEAYPTKRGMRVGDSAEKVESLYGKPNVGFSSDEVVEYKLWLEPWGESEHMQITYFTTMYIWYKDGIVTKYAYQQYILD